MKPGELVRVKTKKDTYEGIVMPRSELADEDHIVIKLGTGYNIGILKKDIQKTEKIKVKPRKGKTYKVEFDKGKPPISLITTGGTITSKVDYKTGGVKSLLNANELLESAPDLKNFVNIKDILQPFSLMSEDMSPGEWGKVAELVAKELNSGVSGVIVTHGTDTLHYTSAALSFMLQNLSKPVAVVGAQRSTDRGSADATQNLLCAAHYCLSDIAEVCIVMHGTTEDDYCIASRGTKVRKMHSSRRDAFRPINDLPLAKIFPDGNIIIENSGHNNRTNGKVTADTSFEEKVALVKVYPGASPSILDFYLDKKYKGIILEGTGFGHVPTKTLREEHGWLPVVKKLTKAGVFVGVTTQALYGRTNSEVYSNLRLLKQAGAVHLGDMLPETAYVKLGWVLGHKNWDVREKMLENIAGEITERIDPGAYLY